jgi:hypothetical protein
MGTDKRAQSESSGYFLVIPGGENSKNNRDIEEILLSNLLFADRERFSKPPPQNDPHG